MGCGLPNSMRDSRRESERLREMGSPLCNAAAACAQVENAGFRNITFMELFEAYLEQVQMCCPLSRRRAKGVPWRVSE